MVRGKSCLARFVSFGCLVSRSIRSLFGPLARMSWRRSRIVGSASRRSGRNSEKNFASFLVAGFDSFTSTSRSSSVPRRSRKVFVPFCSVEGSTPSACESDTFSSPIARVNEFAFATSSDRSVERDASVVTTPEVSVTKRLNSAWSPASSAVSCEVVDSAGDRYFRLSLACLPLPSRLAALPRMICSRPLRVGASRELKSASRSTVDSVCAAVIVPPSGTAFRHQRDVVDLADLAAAALHQVPLHDLAGALELRGDLVAVPAAEHEHGDEPDRRYHRDDRYRARKSGARFPAAPPRWGVS